MTPTAHCIIILMRKTVTENKFLHEGRSEHSIAASEHGQDRNAVTLRIPNTCRPGGNAGRPARNANRESALFEPINSVTRRNMEGHENESLRQAASKCRGRLTPGPRDRCCRIVGGPLRSQ